MNILVKIYSIETLKAYVMPWSNLPLYFFFFSSFPTRATKQTEKSYNETLYGVG